MDGFDSSGRRISLLVEDGAACDDSMYSAGPYNLTQSLCSVAPELSRSSSFDSQMSQGPETPLTPEPTNSDPCLTPAVSPLQSAFFAVQADEKHPRAGMADMADDDECVKAAASTLRPTPHMDREAASERKGKRYPCRLAQQYNCDKTFTTSGHASRHSKIHIAQKSVSCSFHGCPKMFTRTDNMKQHLETHYKRLSDKAGIAGTSAHVAGSPGRSRRRSSASPPSEDTDYASGFESRLPLRSANTRAQSGSSIDSMSLATLAHAAQQVGDM